MTTTRPSQVKQAWPDYRAVWRWHFYASLFCIPFVVILSITGAIYLFKPQIESWNDRAVDHLQLNGERASIAQQVEAALAAAFGATLSGYELPPTPLAAGRVLVRNDGKTVQMYIHPQTLEVLKTRVEQQSFIRWIFRAHGELLLGDRGSNLVELAASWTIIMVVTGLYLWWPRQAKGLGGVLYPRLRAGSRIFWRDLHSVVGMWISLLALFILLTGLPWAKFWGGYFKAGRQLAGVAVARQDWSTGSERSGKRDRNASASGEHEGHGGGGRGAKHTTHPIDLAAMERVVAAVALLELPPPVVIAPPTTADSNEWSAKSTTQNRPLRVNLVVDGRNGAILSREGFAEKHWVDRVVAIGIAAHEGQLFGWPNQLLGLATALGLILLCVSGAILWWRRRDQGVLGAPKVLLDSRVSIGLLVLVILLGIYLPLFGISLLLVLAVEKLVLSRLPRVRDWLGLQSPRVRVAA